MRARFDGFPQRPTFILQIGQHMVPARKPRGGNRERNQRRDEQTRFQQSHPYELRPSESIHRL